MDKIYIKNAREKWMENDAAFHQLYPKEIQLLAKKHWTPIEVARIAADFLVSQKNEKILDIGSGAGKFCIVAGYYKPDAFFYGVEQRKSLIEVAEAAKLKLGIPNAFFIEGNFTQLNFNDYHHFYFYNAFFENIAGTDKIDESIDYSLELYNYYNRYLYKQLETKPAGTKLVTFHSLENEVPRNYTLVDARMDNLLKCWIKI
ncbi:MAG: methyltransferase domain-containing protein [Hydrotalea flava]|uniref:methyltransferase domain-containing protein n=1 Tax=Hydrotalea lipotrueae TaxID=2803817 RepID=UPI001C47BDEA|nr:methyltransferase domain-containing protein [Hydrotalea lipotrueae]MBY0347898.1 methyltransferase domain-containing protein [Hydrotalea flava]